MALVPYPSASMAATRAAARTAIRSALKASETDLPDEDVDRLAGFASARIQKFAPAAPDEAKDEAAIRLVAYMRQRPIALRSIDAGGNLRLEFATSGMQRPFVASGARAMLSPWVTRRALPAVDPDIETA